MIVRFVNAEDKMASIASSAESDPLSWKGWHVLHVSADTVDRKSFNDVAILVKAILESYLHDVEGSAYFCNDKDLFVVCKQVSSDAIKQCGEQIQKMIFNENGASVGYQIYELDEDVDAFTSAVFGCIGAYKEILVSKDSPMFKPVVQDAPKPKHGKNLRVLLVEDDAVTRWMVSNALEDECEFSSADTANRVFSVYPAYDPDIVFLDIGLPDDNGNAVLDWIMKHDPAACVVMLSGRSDADNISGFMEMGAKGFIAKPFVKENLLHYIHQYA